MVDDHRVRNNKLVAAVIKKILSPATYLEEIKPNITWKRHVDQIILYASRVDSQSPSDDVNNNVNSDLDIKNNQPAPVRRSERLKDKN